MTFQEIRTEIQQCADAFKLGRVKNICGPHKHQSANYHYFNFDTEKESGLIYNKLIK